MYEKTWALVILKILILHDYISKKPTLDELDNFEQAKSIDAVLQKLNLKTVLYSCTNYFEKDFSFIRECNPDIVFNLVETYNGTGRNSFMIPMLLEALNIKYTGASSKIIWTTTNKILTKEILLKNNIKTPLWSLIDPKSKNFKNLENNNLVICKSINEDASIGIDKNSVFLLNKDNIKNFDEKSFFIEEYIKGREFNVAIYEDEHLVILPVSEIVFKNSNKNSIDILDYDSKWSPNSKSYKNSIRNFNFKKNDNLLLKNLKEISKNIWEIFKLNGYIRIDYRVDMNNNPYVLEINANPCIANDSGFSASFNEAGFSYEQMVEKILKTTS